MAEGRIARPISSRNPTTPCRASPTRSTSPRSPADPPEWPDSTRRISQLRLTVEYSPTPLLKRALGSGRLHIDIVDYPGEWLLDLPLLDLDFGEWSTRALAEAQSPQRGDAAREWLSFLSTLDAAAPADEQKALTGAQLFTRYLQSARAPDALLTAPGPGRFLLPGDLAARRC